MMTIWWHPGRKQKKNDSVRGHHDDGKKKTFDRSYNKPKRGGSETTPQKEGVRGSQSGGKDKNKPGGSLLEGCW